MKKGKSFENLVSWIHGCLADKAKVIPNHGIPDKDSGQVRQVDVAIYMTDGPYTTLTIVEVRDRVKPVGSSYIEEIGGKRESVRADAAAIVSKSGFSKPALEKAQKLNIRTLTYDEALRDSWVDWAMMKTITVVNRLFEVIRVDFKFVPWLDDASKNDFAKIAKARLQHNQIQFQVVEEDAKFDINSLVKQVLDANPFIWDDVTANSPPLKKRCKINPRNEPPIRLCAGSSLIPVAKLEVILNLKVVKEERPLTYSALKNAKNGTSVSDVLSAIVPYGNEEVRLDIMTKGGSKAIQPDQKVFLRATKL